MMRVIAASPLARRERLLRLVRTPKGTLLQALLVLAAVTAPTASSGRAWRALGIAAAAAVVLDPLLARLRGWGWVLPDGALLSGLLVAMVLSPLVAWWIPAVTSALAIAGKHALRIRRGHVFNPAALALALAALLRLARRAGGGRSPRRSGWCWCWCCWWRAACWSPTASTGSRWWAPSSAPISACSPSLPCGWTPTSSGRPIVRLRVSRAMR